MAFRGIQAPMPVGLQGLHGSHNPSKLGPGHFSFVEGVDYDGDVLTKDGGAQKLNASALGDPSKILAGINWSPVAGEHHDVVVLDNGAILKDTGAGTFGTTLTTISPPTVFPPYFVRAGGEAVGEPRKLFIFSESDQVQVVEGTDNTAADISTPPADWASSFPIFGVAHANRIFAAGNASDPHRIYYTGTTDHEDYSTGGTLAIYPGEGDQIVGAISFRGLLIVYKFPVGVYIVDTRDPDDANWSVTRLNNVVGLCSPWALVQISNDILLMDGFANIHVQSAVDDISDINSSNIGRAFDFRVFVKDNINKSNLKKVMGAWYADRTKAWFMMPGSGDDDNNRRIMLDFNNPETGARLLVSRRDEGSALWMRPDGTGIERPTLGDLDGFIWLMDDDARNKDGAAYDMLMETGENDFSYLEPALGGKTKNGQFLEVTADLVAQTEIFITPVWDGFPGDPIEFLLGNDSAVLGSFLIGTDMLAASGVGVARRKLDGAGRRLKLIIENSSLNEEVRISKIQVDFTVSDERIRNG